METQTTEVITDLVIETENSIITLMEIISEKITETLIIKTIMVEIIIIIEDH